MSVCTCLSNARAEKLNLTLSSLEKSNEVLSFVKVRNWRSTTKNKNKKKKPDEGLDWPCFSGVNVTNETPQSLWKRVGNYTGAHFNQGLTFMPNVVPIYVT